MTGEYLFSQASDQVDDAYFERLRKPLYGHEKSPLEQRVEDAALDEDERQALRAISAEYVVTLAALPDEEQAGKRMALLDTLSDRLPNYYDDVSAGLSRDGAGEALSIVVGGQPLELQELEMIHAAIPPSREALDLLEAEVRIGTDDLIDRTHPNPKDPMHYLANAKDLPAYLADVADPGEGVVEWHEEDCLEPTYPEDIHTGLARELGRIGLHIVDTGKLFIHKIAS